MNASIHNFTEFAAGVDAVQVPTLTEQTTAMVDLAIRCAADSHAVSCLEIVAKAVAGQIEAPELDNRARVQLSQAAHAGSRDDAVALAYKAGLNAAQAVVMQVMLAIASNVPE